MAYLRGREHLCLPVSFTGMAASLLDGGRTAHTRFRLPLQMFENSTSQIRPIDEESHLLRESHLVIWDESTTAHKYAYQCVDRLFRDLTGSVRQFGGKILLLCGDFRQTLPVVKRGTSVDIINACIKKSHIWAEIPVTKNNNHL
jgi:hypothetical protein